MNATTGEEILTYLVEDKLNPTTKSFNFFHGEEAVLEMTMLAINQFEAVPFNFTIEIVGMIRGPIIDDFSIVTDKDELKHFQVSFESLGGGTCIAVHWNDDSDLATYGAPEDCTTHFSWGNHVHSKIDIVMNITHTYGSYGTYTVIMIAKNKINSVQDFLKFVVTSVPCAPPRLTLVDQVLFFANAHKVKRAEDNTLQARASINCELTYRTRMWWRVMEVDSLMGETLRELTVREVVPSWNISQFTIPARFLPYGYYKLVFLITMWDPEVLGPDLPSRKSIHTHPGGGISPDGHIAEGRRQPRQ
ncbi:uncharacterized protein LOC121853101 [Homarus americanus]|uniref:uncharacterized protein LOC121853101 n=1 Tax=Homarus americanus TaxID=6706 RepID=UPI001C48BF69|nr:uncharacterized protein LOC121853101 [Homarus americanus]